MINSVQDFSQPRVGQPPQQAPLHWEFHPGISRILQTYHGYEKQPVFNHSGNFFMLTLSNQNYSDSINNSINNFNNSINDSKRFRGDKLNAFDLAVLQSIQTNPGISTKQILESVQEKYPETTIFEIENSFKRKIRDYVEFKDARRNRGYFIKADFLFWVDDPTHTGESEENADESTCIGNARTRLWHMFPRSVTMKLYPHFTSMKKDCS